MRRRRLHPPAFYEGISTTRHMIGMNLATALAIPVALTLGWSLAAPLVRGQRASILVDLLSHHCKAGS